MTLTEYLNQETPAYKPDVVLQLDEIITWKSGSGYGIQIKLLPQHSYWVDKGTCNLYVMDADGNPSALSCFRLEKKISIYVE